VVEDPLDRRPAAVSGAIVLLIPGVVVSVALLLERLQVVVLHWVFSAWLLCVAALCTPLAFVLLLLARWVDRRSPRSG